jgi:mannosylglycoprotein endo-beta-mannosidase
MVGNVKLQLAIVNLIIMRFDCAQEHRQLQPEERWLRNTLKVTALGLSSLERTIARQRSWLRWIQEGDANTKLFHAVANGRRAKKFIPAVRVGEQMLTDQGDKEEAFFRAYSRLLGETTVRAFTVDLDVLGIHQRDLSDLDALFTEEECGGKSKICLRIVRRA